ncbi:MAG: hypothetical protein AAFO99_02420 [Bacteroidota bacterium]
MNKIIDKLIFSFMLLGILASCSEKQDFDQFDEIQIDPTLEASILFVEATESVINLAPNTSFFSQEFNFDAFSEEEYVTDRVVEGFIIYEVENTTSKELDILVEFLDEGGNVLDTELFEIDPEPQPILQREVFYGPGGRSIDIIKNLSGIRVSAINLGDTTSVSSLPDPKVILRSSGRFTFSLR